MVRLWCAFVLAGGYPVYYGISSDDPELAAELGGLRNTGTTIRVWGQVTCGIMDANGCRIQVTRIEIVGEPPAPSPTPPPSPTPTQVVEEPVDGWGGTIVQLLMNFWPLATWPDWGEPFDPSIRLEYGKANLSRSKTKRGR